MLVDLVVGRPAPLSYRPVAERTRLKAGETSDRGIFLGVSTPWLDRIVSLYRFDKMNDEPPPGCITCPITGNLFVHPVLLPDGWTYEMEYVTSTVKTTKNRLMLDLVRMWSNTKLMPNVDDWEGYRCPITKDRMQQPALASDGFTYELVAIEAWVFQYQTSPMTREPITSVTPDRVIQALVTRSGRPRVQATSIIPWQIQVDMWCNLFENLLDAIELAASGRDANHLASILASLRTSAVLGLPAGYDPLLPLPARSDFRLPAELKYCTIVQLLRRVVKLLYKLCTEEDTDEDTGSTAAYEIATGYIIRMFPRLQARYRARLQSILDPEGVACCMPFWTTRLQDLLTVVRQTVFTTGSDEEHYELWMASQQCISALATLSDSMTAFLVVRDLETMFITLAQEQGPHSEREARMLRRRVARLVGQ